MTVTSRVFRTTLAALIVLTFACSKERAGAAAASQEPLAGGPQSTEVDARMPDYSATNLDGTRFDLASQRGSVVLLNLWATWCGPCRGEIPDLQQLHDKYSARGFKVIGVSLDDGGPDAVRQFVTAQKMTYPIALDPQAKIATILQTSVIPTSLILDRQGKIVWKKYGALSTADDDLIKALESALSKS